LALFWVALFLRGVGLAVAQMPAMTAAYGAVEKRQTGDAATLLNIGQRLGGAVGVIPIVALLENASSKWAVIALLLFAFEALLTSRALAGRGSDDRNQDQR
jgi:uncharacterized membrane protein